jgi:hypothetical protein
MLRAPRTASRIASLVACALACASAVGCRGQSGREDTSEPPASPQANAVPAPLTTSPAPPASATSSSPDAGPPPETPLPSRPFAPDTATRDGPGYALVAVLRFLEVPGIARGDLSSGALEAARKKVEPSFAVDLMPARARVVLRGKGFLLPEGTEIRMRSDIYGAALVTDAGAVHRVLMPGTLRALFNERRLDVGPLTAAELTSNGEGARRLGYRTRKVEVWTRAAKTTFEIARVQDAGEGGVLLCRFLLDWMSALPSTPLCSEGEIPLHAELHWTARGILVFDAVSIVRRLDVPAATLLAPPPLSRFTTEPLGGPPGALFFSSQELSALRPGGEPSKLLLLDSADEPRIAWVDGLPLGWVAPNARLEAQGLPKAKVTVDWRTFFDDAEKLPSQTVSLPASSDASGTDGGL